MNQRANTIAAIRAGIACTDPVTCANADEALNRILESEELAHRARKIHYRRLVLVQEENRRRLSQIGRLEDRVKTLEAENRILSQYSSSKAVFLTKLREIRESVNAVIHDVSSGRF